VWVECDGIEIERRTCVRIHGLIVRERRERAIHPFVDVPDLALDMRSYGRELGSGCSNHREFRHFFCNKKVDFRESARASTTRTRERERMDARFPLLLRSMQVKATTPIYAQSQSTAQRTNKEKDHKVRKDSKGNGFASTTGGVSGWRTESSPFLPLFSETHLLVRGRSSSSRSNESSSVLSCSDPVSKTIEPRAKEGGEA